jgi:hypothetical protein
MLIGMADILMPWRQRFRTLLNRPVWRDEIFVVLREHAFAFRKGFAHAGKSVTGRCQFCLPAFSDQR